MKDGTEIVEAFIWHDAEGNIVAVGYATGTEQTVEPVAQPEHGVIRTRLRLEALHELHQTHVVQPGRGELLPKERLTPAD